ncbi:hypothetical protein VP01_6589g1 [Puccinia sorghi]|uniref:Uncharacterized protein n=1 Tax=Puccinia sorghi TaxID=27349 RepID=A0A0L6UF75_9BASI|nr:hypothetical protein VP01_6589g1 [Puccinia sorghi]
MADKTRKHANASSPNAQHANRHEATSGKVIPQNPNLSCDGSNYTQCEKAIVRALQHAFVMEKLFIKNEQDNFLSLDLLHNKAITGLMCSKMENALLSIVESDGRTLSKVLFDLLKSKHQCSGLRHKIILVEKILIFAVENLPASESWLAQFCTIMTDLEQAKFQSTS